MSELSNQFIGESKKGRMADALAHRGDEGRDKLRKVAGRSKYPVIRQSPNGTTHCPEGTVSLIVLREANAGN